MNRFTVIVALSIVSVWSAAFGQDGVGMIQQPIIVARKVGIKNLDESNRVNFALKEQNQPWQNYSLEPGEAQDFRCGESCLFFLRTVDKPPVRVRLKAEQRYGIFWSNDAAVWDIDHVSE